MKLLQEITIGEEIWEEIQSNYLRGNTRVCIDVTIAHEPLERSLFNLGGIFNGLKNKER